MGVIGVRCCRALRSGVLLLSVGAGIALSLRMPMSVHVQLVRVWTSLVPSCCPIAQVVVHAFPLVSRRVRCCC
eukprot:6928491-Prorocentrum_lima.AAC.1